MLPPDPPTPRNLPHIQTTQKWSSCSGILGKHYIEQVLFTVGLWSIFNMVRRVMNLRKVSLWKTFFFFCPLFSLFKNFQDIRVLQSRGEEILSYTLSALVLVTGQTPPLQKGLLWPSWLKLPSLPCAIILFCFLCNTTIWSDANCLSVICLLLFSSRM